MRRRRLRKRPPSEIERVLAARPKASPATLPSPRVPGRYSEADRAKIAAALEWKVTDPRLSSVIARLEEATAYLPLDRSGPQGPILREIGRLGTRLVVLLDDLSFENRRAIDAMNAESVIAALKSRALAAAPRRGRSKTRDPLRPFIECAANIYEEAVGKPPTCSYSRGTYRGRFLTFISAAVRPFKKHLAEVGFAETVATTLKAIRQHTAGDKSRKTQEKN